MAALAQPEPGAMTLEEYLHTSFRPDCDFVDDHIEERNMGEFSHGLLQVEVAFWFRSHRDEWDIRTLTELRTRVSERRVRIPDIMVTHNDGFRDPVRLHPPLIAIEILSPEDRLPRVLVRLADFWQMGVRNIWLLDPEDRTAFVYTDAGLRPVAEPFLKVPNTPIYLDLPQVFAGLN